MAASRNIKDYNTVKLLPNEHGNCLSQRVMDLVDWDAAESRLPKQAFKASRDISQGYRRGWGLQFGKLSEKIDRDIVFQNAFKAIQNCYAHSILPKARLQNLYLLITEMLPLLEGQNIIEFGSYRGGTAIFMAMVLKEVSPKSKVFALDTFSGIPEANDGKDFHVEGDFSDVDLSRIEARCESLGLNNLVFVKGNFQTTFPELDIEQQSFGLAHIDCDTYSSVSYAQQAAWIALCRGGYIVYDDADSSSCLGATEAMENMVMERNIHSEQVWPHFVFRKEDGVEESKLLNIMNTRRQTRAFTKEFVDEDIKDALFQHMHSAPSVGNSRPWRIVELSSPKAHSKLTNIFQSAKQVTTEDMTTKQLKSFEKLGIEGFLDAPLQLSIFTEQEPEVGHRQGWATFPDALTHSTICALHSLWLAAEAYGLGFAWVSTLHPFEMEKEFSQDSSWRFTAHVAIGHPAETLTKPKHELCGFQSHQDISCYKV